MQQRGTACLKQQATCYAELLETTGNMLLAVTRNCMPDTTCYETTGNMLRIELKQQATCYAELKTKGNNWSVLELERILYRLDTFD